MRGRGFRSGLMVKPEFGFFSNLDSERVGASRPQRLHSSRVYFSEYASDEGLKEKYKSYQKDIRNSRQEQLMYRFSRQGKLVVVNSGKANRGFLICQSCGYAETAALKARKSDREHRNAFDRPCRGRLETRHLGHEFLTDVLELRFLAIAPYDPERSTWWSLLYALLLGASEELGIERRDIDGCLYPYGERTRPPAIVLFDNIPGGAGHVRRIGENLQDVLEKTYQLADGCQSCDEETACYGCLKTYDNQFCHHMLQRGPVSKFLMGFFDAAT